MRRKKDKSNGITALYERLSRDDDNAGESNSIVHQKQKRDQDVHFLASKEEVERIHEKMDELGIRSMGAYLRKMALDGYCIRLDLQDVKALVSLLRICSNNLNQYAKRANETGSIYHADIEDLQKRLEEIWTDMREVLVRLSSIQ